jgi:hypothetical protein
MSLLNTFNDINIKKRKLFQYLLDIEVSLNCPLQKLIDSKIFTNEEEIHDFINIIEDGNNFAILAKQEINNAAATKTSKHLFFVPFLKCPYDKLESKCTDKKCRNFHLENICYYFLYENNCKYKNKCKSSHTINRSNNVFNDRKLNDASIVDDQMLSKLIQLSEKFSLKICKYGTEECTEENCGMLHCCFFHFTGKMCKNNNVTCPHKHSLFDESNKKHNEVILREKCLLDLNEFDLRNFIVDAINGKKQKCKTLNANNMLPPIQNLSLKNKNRSVPVHRNQAKPKNCSVCNHGFVFNTHQCGCSYCSKCNFKFYQADEKKCLNKNCSKR